MSEATRETCKQSPSEQRLFFRLLAEVYTVSGQFWARSCQQESDPDSSRENLGSILSPERGLHQLAWEVSRVSLDSTLVAGGFELPSAQIPDLVLSWSHGDDSFGVGEDVEQIWIAEIVRIQELPNTGPPSYRRPLCTLV